jgi:hypothetical protein
LVFDVEGGDAIPETKADLDDISASAGKAALVLDGVVAAMGLIVRGAVNSAVALQKFAYGTALSGDELRQWQYTAALANVSAGELENGVKSLQLTGAKVALTGQGAGPWLLLGIDPRSNPFDILKRLNVELQSVNANRIAAARLIANEAGISDDLFQALRRNNLEIDKLQQYYLLTPKNKEDLAKLNEEWQRLEFHLGATSDRFGGVLAPALITVFGWINHLVDKTAQFVNWLQSGSTAATVTKDIIISLAATLTVAAGVLTTVATATKVFSIALGALDITLSPILGTITLIVAALAAATLGFTDLSAAVQHFNDKGPRPIYPEGIGGPAVRPKRTAKPGEPGFDYGPAISGPSASVLKDSHAMGALVDLLNRLPGGGSSRNTTVTVNSPVTITGNANPSAVVTAVRDGHQQALVNAGLSSPAQTR